MRQIKSIIILILPVFLIIPPCVLYADQSPVTDSHISAIHNLFKENNIPHGFVSLDRFGRVELKGEYLDEREVDRAFSLAQTVVGVRWVSPVTPESIKIKEWERKLGKIFERAKILKPPVKEGEQPGPLRNRYAVIVGIGTFRNGIAPLQYAVRDATEVYQFVTDPGRGAFPKENVMFITDQDATRNNIVNALERIKNMAEPDDLVVVYMSSHGTPPDKFGGVHIVTYDTEVKPRERVWHTSLNEGMIKDFVENLMAKRLVIIFDTCYSNGAYKGVPGFLPPGGKSLGTVDEEGYGISADYGKRLLGAKDIVIKESFEKPGEKTISKPQEDSWGTVLISASGAGEKSWESDTLHQSIFTYYFLDGLNRYNGNLKNAFYHAKPLVYQRVKKEKGIDIEQTPQVLSTQSALNMRIFKK